MCSKELDEAWDIVRNLEDKIDILNLKNNKQRNLLQRAYDIIHWEFCTTTCIQTCQELKKEL